MAAHAARAMLQAAVLSSVPLANQLARHGEVHRRKRSMPGSSPKSLVRCLMLLSVGARGTQVGAWQPQLTEIGILLARKILDALSWCRRTGLTAPTGARDHAVLPAAYAPVAPGSSHAGREHLPAAHTQRSREQSLESLESLES